MNKRGVSSVVTTILIILIGIAAVAIIAVLIYSYIRVGAGEIQHKQEAISLSGQFDVSLAYYNPGENISLLVKRKAGQENVTGIYIVLTDEFKQSHTFNQSINFSEFSLTPVYFDYSSTGLGNLTSVEVYPIYMDSI